MESYYFDACVVDGTVYCVGCLLAEVDTTSPECRAIYTDEEWNEYPVCEECGRVHDCVRLTRVSE